MPFLLPSASRRSLAENDAHVFHGVVLVHVQVAACRDLQVETAVAGEKLEHVIEEANAGGNLVAPAAVQVQTVREYRSRR